MKLLVVVVQDQDAPGLLNALAEQKIIATKLASTGGFLSEGNTTLLIGIDQTLIPKVKEIISQRCHTRERVITPGLPATEHLEGYVPHPIEVPVGGAVVFVLSTEEFVKL
ncbi:MAG: cyclic-di-AMP receptor [Deinococcus sp.]|nr:cyclic-di-AMP receptor [Deinococcus sp.]